MGSRKRFREEGGEGKEEMNTPLEQFEIHPIERMATKWTDISITNSAIIEILGVTIILLGLRKSIDKRKTTGVLRKELYLLELGYIKIEELLKDMMPVIDRKYIPMILTLFCYIFINNVLGLIPELFTPTSHFIMTLTLSLTIIIGVTLRGFIKHKLHFFLLFVPHGLTGFVRILIPFIFCIEILSYLIRIISLSVRLAANLLSGHTLLNIVANFGYQLTTAYPFLFLFPIFLLIGIYLLEIGVACIQAYVFTLLTASYIKDSELLH